MGGCRGVLSDRDAVIRLVGAVVAERHDEWVEQRRCLGLELPKRCRTALTMQTPDKKEDILAIAGTLST